MSSEGNPTPYVPSAEQLAKNAEQARKGAFYKSIEDTVEDVLVGLEEVDMAKADKFVMRRPLVVEELDKRTGGDAGKVTKEMVLAVFEELTKR